MIFVILYVKYDIFIKVSKFGLYSTHMVTLNTMTKALLYIFDAFPPQSSLHHLPHIFTAKRLSRDHIKAQPILSIARLAMDTNNLMGLT